MGLCRADLLCLDAIRIWAISYLTAIHRMPSGNTISACASASCPRVTVLPAYCRGGLSTTVRFRLALTRFDCRSARAGITARNSRNTKLILFQQGGRPNDLSKTDSRLKIYGLESKNATESSLKSSVSRNASHA
jgi:hypothetical protein